MAIDDTKPLCVVSNCHLIAGMGTSHVVVSVAGWSRSALLQTFWFDSNNNLLKYSSNPLYP